MLISYSVSPAEVTEGGVSKLSVTYTPEDNDDFCDISVSSSIAGTAKAGEDYVSFSVNTLNLDYREQISALIVDPVTLELEIQTNDDSLAEANEDLALNLFFTDNSGVGDDSTCPISSIDSLSSSKILINDNDNPTPVSGSFTTDNLNPVEGEFSNLSVSFLPQVTSDMSGCSLKADIVILNAGAQGVASLGDDFTWGGGTDSTHTVHFGDEPGIFKKNFYTGDSSPSNNAGIPVQITDDIEQEPNETITLQATFSSENEQCVITGPKIQEQTITIQDNDVQESLLDVSLNVDNPTPSEDVSTVNLRVSFDLQGEAPPDQFCNASATLRVVEEETTATQGTDFTFNPAEVTFSSGDPNQKTVNIPLQILPDGLPESNETITIEAVFSSVDDPVGQSSCPLTLLPDRTVSARNTAVTRKITLTLSDSAVVLAKPTAPVVFDDTCETLVRMFQTEQSMTPGQFNMLKTCQENEQPDEEILAPEENFAVAVALMDTTKMQLTNINARLLAIRRSGTRKIDGSGVRMRINGEAVPNSVFQGSSGRVYEQGGSDSDPLPDSIFKTDNSGSVYEEDDGAYQLKGGGGSADEVNDLLASTRWGAFVNGEFIFGEKDESTGERGFDFDSRGITAGLDYRLPGDKTIIGAAIGYNDYDSSFSSQVGSMNLRGIHLSAYGTYMLSDKGYLDGILSIGRGQVDIERPVLYVPSELPPGAEKPVARGNPDTSELTLSVGAGYDYSRKNLTFTPFARIDYTSVTIDGFTETASHPSAMGVMLHINEQKLDSTSAVLGARATYAISTSRAVFLPQASFEWKHKFDGGAREIEAQFVNDPNNASFFTASDRIDQDYLTLGLGVSAVFPGGKSGFLYVESQQGHDSITETAIKAGIRIEF